MCRVEGGRHLCNTWNGDSHKLLQVFTDDVQVCLLLRTRIMRRIQLRAFRDELNAEIKECYDVASQTNCNERLDRRDKFEGLKC